MEPSQGPKHTIFQVDYSLRDQAVASLLHSKDLVEVQRAGIIIREIPCSIGWRIRDDEKAHL